MSAEAPAPATAQSARPAVSRAGLLKFRRRGLIALAILTVFVAAGYAFREKILWSLGQRLTSDEAPRKADVILVLGGDLRGNRILRAAELLQDGYAPRVLVGGMANLYGSSEGDRAIEFAVHHGANPAFFTPLRYDVNSTVEEATSDLIALRRLGIHSCLLVTSAYHTRRSGEIFRRLAPDLEFHTIAAPDPYWNNGYWWTNREGRKLWLYEAMKSAADIFRI